MTYKLIAPLQRRWNPTNGTWEPVEPYTSKEPIWGVNIVKGEGTVEDPLIAVEFFDMGYQVIPDPHEAAQAAAQQKNRMRPSEEDEGEAIALVEELQARLAALEEKKGVGEAAANTKTRESASKK